MRVPASSGRITSKTRSRNHSIFIKNIQNFCWENRKFSGCPPGVPPPAFFPSNLNAVTKSTWQQGEQKTASGGQEIYLNPDSCILSGFKNHLEDLGGNSKMCGIVGYNGWRNATPIILNGLRRLEYRGYDSSGMPCYRMDKLKFAVTQAN